MAGTSLGELVPIGGGDSIPLKKARLQVGRRESCDVVLRFANVSAHHCELTLVDGYWYVRDLNSRNGVKVNGHRATEKIVAPGDELAIGKHKYKLEYSPIDLGAVGPPPDDAELGKILGKSLLERAGLSKSGEETKSTSRPMFRNVQDRYDVLNHEAGQVKLPNQAK